MRWDDQRVENDLRLPGVGDGAVVRTFDAPEAMGINFHEVRARSALNHVPGGRYGFSWTINQYRGCSHACAYCLAGETPVLMADGRTRQLAELRVGDSIYGTVRHGSYRRYEITEVLAQWQTRKEAYRVVLGDGTELIASGDHRFLTDRGWKYVTGAEQGRGQRPFLTKNNKLMGFGSLGSVGGAGVACRRGCLCGTIRGDGHVGTYHRSMMAIRTSAKEAVDRIRDLICWPDSPEDEWTRGFLAGIFDAEGCRSGVLRISNSDDEMIARTVDGLRQFGFASTVEKPPANGVANARLLGGLSEQLRFLHRTDPAISRKRSIEGIAIKSQAKLGVAAIEPLGREMEMYDITTGTGDFMADGVVSHNCFARRTHTYLGFDAGQDFEREIVVKVNVPELVRAELARPSWKRELVAMGTNTDPYQWVESRYRMMPEILAALEAAGTPITILTKSPLVLRDVEILERMAKRLPVSVNLSVPTLDEAAWRATEPHTPSPAARLDAVAELRGRGIDSGVLVAPLMPGINDDPEQVRPIIERARAADATFLGSVALHLRGEVKDVFFAWLAEKRPDLVSRYEALYRDRSYMRPAQRKHATRAVKGWGRARLRRSLADRSEQPPSGAADLPVGGSGGDPENETLARRGLPPRQAPPAQCTLF